MMVSCQYCFCAAAVQSSCDRDRFEKVSYGALESGWPSLDSSWQCYYMLLTTNNLSMPFHVWKEIFFLGLVTEINIKKKYRNKT